MQSGRVMRPAHAIDGHTWSPRESWRREDRKHPSGSARREARASGDSEKAHVVRKTVRVRAQGCAMGQRKTMLVGTAGAAEKILFDCRDAGTASEDSLREGFLEAIEGNFHDEGAARCRLGSSSGCRRCDSGESGGGVEQRCGKDSGMTAPKQYPTAPIPSTAA